MVSLFLCFCDGVVVILWWCGCVFVVAVVFLWLVAFLWWCLCVCVFVVVVVWLCFCGCVGAIL